MGPPCASKTTQPQRLTHRNAQHIETPNSNGPDNLSPRVCPENLSPRDWLPRKTQPKTRTDVPGLTKKTEQLPHQQRALTLEMLSMHYPQKNWMHAYTDGSAAENAVRKGEAVFTSEIRMTQPTSSPFQTGTPVPATEPSCTRTSSTLPYNI